jgi:hypothetical protein
MSGRKHVRQTEGSEQRFRTRRDVLADASRSVVHPLENRDCEPAVPESNGGCKAGGTTADYNDVNRAQARGCGVQWTVPKPITTPVG